MSISAIIILKQSIVKEKSLNAELTGLSNDFYQKLKVELNTFNGRNIDQIQLLLNDLFRIRHSKIIQFASVMKLNQSIRGKLTADEIEFYEEIQKASMHFKNSILN